VFSRLHVLAAVVAACLLAAVTPVPAVEPREQLVRATYPVADLVIPIAESAKTARMGKPQPTLEDRLIRQIVRTVQPATWNDNGGKGTIQYFGPTMSLVVNQTPQIQEQVAGLLARLRKDQDMQVALEIRFVSIPEDACERIGVDFGVPSGAGHHLRFLNETQMVRFLEAAATDKRTCVTTAPKLTALNRQAISLKMSTGLHEWATAEPWHAKLVAEFGEQGDPNKTGWHVTARPVVSADQRFVKLSLNVEQWEAPPAVRKTIAVPDGGTVLIDGFQATAEVQRECPQQGFSNIPYINRLFRVVCASREPRRVFVLVTPRIVFPEEEEEKVGTTTSRTDAAVDVPMWRAVSRTEPVAEEPLSRQAKVLAELLRAYDAACTEGRSAEAEKLAHAALILDPTCFHRK
jgi:Flp pilus assembly secretin CpaC